MKVPLNVHTFVNWRAIIFQDRIAGLVHEIFSVFSPHFHLFGDYPLSSFPSSRRKLLLPHCLSGVLTTPSDLQAALAAPFLVFSSSLAVSRPFLHRPAELHGFWQL